MAQPTAEYGELAVEAVLAKRRIGDRLLGGTLVVRESTSAPTPARGSARRKGAR